MMRIELFSLIDLEIGCFAVINHESYLVDLYVTRSHFVSNLRSG